MHDADGVPSQNYFVFFIVYLTGDASLRDKLAVSFFGCFFYSPLVLFINPSKTLWLLGLQVVCSVANRFSLLGANFFILPLSHSSPFKMRNYGVR